MTGHSFLLFGLSLGTQGLHVFNMYQLGEKMSKRNLYPKQWLRGIWSLLFSVISVLIGTFCTLDKNGIFTVNLEQKVVEKMGRREAEKGR